MRIRRRHSIWSLPALLLLGACGAGVVTGGILGGQSSDPSPPPALAPEILVSENEGPLFLRPGQGVPRAVVVNNVQVSPSARVTVELRALGAVSEQAFPSLRQEPGSAVVTFFVRTDEIRERVADWTAADVPAEIAVLLDGVEVAPPQPFLLRRQPSARLRDPSPGGPPPVALLPCSGGGRIEILVDGLVAGVDTDADVIIATPDLTGQTAGIITQCTDVEVSADPAGSDSILITCTAPPNRFPTPAPILVEDPVSGASTAVLSISYVPTISGTVPRRGSLSGGDLVTASGDGLVPLDLGVPGSPRLDFTRQRVVIRKQSREVALETGAVVSELSSLTNLVWVVPPSPDGRPGPADLVLQVLLDNGVTVETVAKSAFSYGANDPFFGPRGVSFAVPPLRVRSGPLVQGGGSPPLPDLVVLEDAGPLPRLRTVRSSGNGMFEPDLESVAAGAPNTPAQRDPVDLLIGAFGGDPGTDALVLNRGEGGVATHTLVLGDASTGAPTQFVGGVHSGPADVRAGLAGDFDEDGLQDLLLMPAGGEPRLLIRDLDDAGFRAGVSGLPAGRAFDVAEVIDLDGDQHLDLLVAVGGLVPAVAVAFGVGDGSFEDVFVTDLQFTAYQPRNGALAVGVHGQRLQTGVGITVVLAGSQGLSSTPPTLLTVPVDPGTRLPTGGSTEESLAPLVPLSTSASGDLDGDGVDELLVGFGGPVDRPLRLFNQVAGRFVDRVGAVGLGDVPVLRARGVEFARVSVGGVADPDGESAVLLFHDSIAEQGFESRITTLVVDPDNLLLLSPVSRINAGVSIRRVLGIPGDPEIDGAPESLGVLLDDAFLVYANDGLGGFRETVFKPLPGAVEESVAVFRQGRDGSDGAGIALLSVDGAVGVVDAESNVALSDDLRSGLPEALRLLPVSTGSRVLADDVNGDAIADLVVFMVLGGGANPGEGDAALFVLLGLDNPPPGTFPFAQPQIDTQPQLTHGGATGVVLADFVAEGSEARRLELALAIPGGAGGNQIRFFRYEPGDLAIEDDDRMVRSFADPLVTSLDGGFGPTLLGSSDFDGNGAIDLVVAASEESQLRIYLNDGSSFAGSRREVNIEGFQLTDVRSIPVGRPATLLLADVDGDQIDDMVVHVETLAPERAQELVVQLSDGSGRFAGQLPVSRLRSGDLRVDEPSFLPVPREAGLTLAIASVNQDGFRDLILSWGPDPFGEDSHVRVLFGGFR